MTTAAPDEAREARTAQGLGTVAGGPHAADVALLRLHGRSWTSAAATSGPPIVLVHGLGVASRMCRPLARHLSSHANVHAPDLPGFGDSDKPDEALGISALGDALAAWTIAAGLSPAVLVGTSLGCQVATAAAARHPACCAALVLGAPTVDRTRRSWRRQLWRWQLEQATQSLGLRRIQLSDYARCGPGRVLRTFASALRDRPEQRLRQVPQPVLVCRGTRDPLVSERWVRELADAAPAGRLATLPGGRHALSHESPLEFARVISRFVDDQPIARR